MLQFVLKKAIVSALLLSAVACGSSKPKSLHDAALSVGAPADAGGILAETPVSGSEDAIAVGYAHDANLSAADLAYSNDLATDSASGRHDLAERTDGLAGYSTDAAGAADAGGQEVGDAPDGASAIATLTPTIVEIPIPMVGIYYSMPMYIAAGSDGNVWFTSSNRNNIGRVTPDGRVTEFPIPTGRPFYDSSNPGNLVLGPDGNLWFRESSKIASISTQGTITEFQVPSSQKGANTITVGPDGAIWFTEPKDAVGRMTLEGAFTEFPVPLAKNTDWYTEDIGGIATGPDGNMWIADYGGNIARMALSGTITQFKMPNSIRPSNISAGGDGAMWFTEDQYAYRIGRITTSGTISEIQLPAMDRPERILLGPDGNLWCAVMHEHDGYILRISQAAALTKFPIPTPNGGPFDVAVTADGRVWFTQSDIDRIGYFLP